jgi:hypothetical protein
MMLLRFVLSGRGSHVEDRNRDLQASPLGRLDHDPTGVSWK